MDKKESPENIIFGLINQNKHKELIEFLNKNTNLDLNIVNKDKRTPLIGIFITNNILNNNFFILFKKNNIYVHYI